MFFKKEKGDARLPSQQLPTDTGIYYFIDIDDTLMVNNENLV